MLSPEQTKVRDGRLTASRVAALMGEDPQALLDLWREMIGDPTYSPPDLSDIWAVQLGSWTEELNLDWYEKRTGRKLSGRGDVMIHPEHNWAACTLDAFDGEIPAPVECKHVGGFEKTSTILERYAPQGHWQMIVTGTTRCVFSIIEGAREPVIENMEWNGPYAGELWRRAKQFMECVRTLTPPVSLPPVPPPVKAEKIIDMTGNNVFANEAVTWATTRQAAKDNEAASKALKAMVPADAVKCLGYGVAISRSRTGALSIREQKE